MSIFTAVDGWFKKQEAAVEKLFHRIEPLVAKAEPIVQEVATVASEAAVEFPAMAPEAAILAALEAYLKKAIADEGVVDKFLAANANVPVNNLLHNAATLALQYAHGQTAVAISDLDTAVQLAYSTVKSTAVASKPAN